MKENNTPILGDRKYGKKDGYRNMLLHANEIILKSRENSGIEMIEKGSKGVAKLVVDGEFGKNSLAILRLSFFEKPLHRSP